MFFARAFFFPFPYCCYALSCTFSSYGRQSLPAVSELKADEVEKFSTSDKVVVIGHFTDKSSAEYKAFESVANKLRDSIVFGYTSSPEGLAKRNVQSPGVVLFKSFDEKLNTFGGDFTVEDLEAFIAENSMPNMDDIGPDNFETYMEKGLPILYLFVSTDEERKTAGAEVEPLAKDYKGQVSFVYLDAAKYGGHAESVNLKQEWPAVGVSDMTKNLKFPYDQSKKIKKADIKAWVDNILAGKVEPSLKSEPVPESNDGPVKVVVGTTYASIVKDLEKDVLVEFYAPWCGHCKKLASIWEELGENIKSEKITIAKMDATANDLPTDAPFTLQGFPTIKLFKAKTGEIVDYEGDRSLESLTAFVKQNAVHGDEVTLVEGSGETSGESEEGGEHDEL